MEALMKERMCKFIFSALLLCASFAGKGQTVDGKLYTIFNNWYQWSGGKFNTNLNIPKVTATTGRDTGGIRYALADSSMYIWTGSQWRKVGDGGATPTLQQVTTAGNITSDTIKIKDYLNNNLINLGVYQNSGNPNSRAGFLDIRNNQNTNRAQYNFEDIEFRSDTKYLRLQASLSDNLNNVVTLDLPDTSGTLSAGVAINGTTYMAGTNGIADLGTISSDTTSLSNRINERVKYTDTAAILSPYLRSNVAAATYQPIGNYDTATVVKAYVTNAEAVTITKGQVVYIFGASGDRASVKLAKNTSDTFSSKTLGIVRANIAAGQAGWITTQGQVSGINLSAYNPGDILWLDSVPGGFTKNKPQAPYHSVFVGVVERANAGNGLIYVKPANGVELDELHDIRITSPTNNQVLAYTAATDIWENKTISTDTTSLSNRINAKVNISDTANMLNPYLRKVDTLSLSNRINAVSNSTGIRWTGVDSSFASNLAANGEHEVEEFKVLGISQFGNVILPGNKWGFVANDGSYIGFVDNGVNGIRLGTSTITTAAPYLNLSHTGAGNAVQGYQLTSDNLIITGRVRIPNLSDVTNSYYIKFGFWATSINQATMANGIAFTYDLSGTQTGSSASSNWQTVTASSNARTYNQNYTATTVTANTWVKLRIIANTTDIKFYINNTLVATHTTNLPTAQNLIPFFDLRKTAGSTARTFEVDYYTLDIKYSTPR
jgi:hypothetical protein